MKNKQEIVNFLESKVGTKVPCPGNTSLDGMCVSLIKSLMEFLGVSDPYKARGHAKTAISSYVSEGLAKQGQGTLSVFSNKDMGSGYGHIWIGIDGTFYESNGVKPLTVTKGKTYAYDMVCNFDSYLEVDPCLNYKKELDEKNVHIANLEKQVAGLSGEKKQLTLQIDELNSQLGGVRGELATTLSKVDSQNKIIQSYVGEDAVQLETIKTFQRERDEARGVLLEGLNDISYITKVPRGSDSAKDEFMKQIRALDGLLVELQRTKEGLKMATDEHKVKDKYIESILSNNEKLTKKLANAKSPLEKIPPLQVIIMLVEKLLKRS